MYDPYRSYADTLFGVAADSLLIDPRRLLEGLLTHAGQPILADESEPIRWRLLQLWKAVLRLHCIPRLCAWIDDLSFTTFM